MATDLESVRARPGMYIGGTDASGLHHLALEVIGNSVDQFILQRATNVSVELDDGWLTVTDDGAGFSLDVLEAAFTTMHDTPTRDGPRPHVHVTHSGLGVGLGPVSALSVRLEVESHRDGVFHRIAFSRGVVVEPLTCVGPTTKQGVRLRLLPDPEIFKIGFDFAELEASVRRLAYLSPRLSWRLQNTDASKPGGLLSFIEEAADSPLVPGSMGQFETDLDGVVISFAVALCERARAASVPPVSSWVNLSPTLEGGGHDAGFRAGLADAFPTWLRLEPRFIGAIHVVLADPRFEGPTKARLAVPGARSLVREFVGRELSNRSDLSITWLEVLSR